MGRSGWVGGRRRRRREQRREWQCQKPPKGEKGGGNRRLQPTNPSRQPQPPTRRSSPTPTSHSCTVAPSPSSLSFYYYPSFLLHSPPVFTLLSFPRCRHGCQQSIYSVSIVNRVIQYSVLYHHHLLISQS